MAGRRYSERTLKILFARSSGRCAFPDCRAKLVIQSQNSDSTAVLAEIAHIKGLSNLFRNLLLLVDEGCDRSDECVGTVGADTDTQTEFPLFELGEPALARAS